MLEIGNIREHKERILAGLHKKNASNEQIALVDKIIAEDDNRKNIQTQLDNLLSKTNKLSDEIGILFKTGKAAEASDLKNQVSNLKEESKSLDIKLREIKDNLEEMIIQLPNTPHESVPVGSKPEDNEVFQGWEQPLPELGSDALPHWELAEKYNLISFKDGVTLTGSGFPVYKGKGARLQRALINFFLDEAVAAGYQEVQPPLLVNKDTARATGQLPDKEGQMYYCEKDDFYLIPTAEVPLTNLYRDTILSKMIFPLK
jgi:seryl-tRNA synthetase